MKIKLKRINKIVSNDKNIESIISNIINNYITIYETKDNISFTINDQNYTVDCKTIIIFEYIYPDNVITYDKINKFKKLFKNHNGCVFGKGPTFINKNKLSNEIFFGINQTVNFIDCDFFCANDLHNIYKVNDYGNIKYILIPEYLHINGKFNIKGYWFQVYKYLKGKFNGEFIIYNLRTSLYPNNKLITIPKCKTSCNTAVNFICIFTNIKTINTYGIGVISKDNYKNIFVGNGTYDAKRIKIIKSEMVEISNKYDVKLVIK